MNRCAVAGSAERIGTRREAVWYFRDRDLDDTQVPEPAPRRSWWSRLFGR